MTSEARLPMEHRLKIWEAQYHRVRSGEKTFELRKNDRGYQRGDTLFMEAFDPRQRVYLDPKTHPPIRRLVTHVLSGGMFGLMDNYVCMSITPLGMAHRQKTFHYLTLVEGLFALRAAGTLSPELEAEIASIHERLWKAVPEEEEEAIERDIEALKEKWAHGEGL